MTMKTHVLTATALILQVISAVAQQLEPCDLLSQLSYVDKKKGRQIFSTVPMSFHDQSI